MANEEDAKQIINFSLVPVCPVVETCDARNWRCLVGVCLDPNPGVVAHAQEVIDDFESLVSGREINRSDIGDLRELCSCVVCNCISIIPELNWNCLTHTFEKGKNGDHARWRDVDNQLILPH